MTTSHSRVTPARSPAPDTTEERTEADRPEKKDRGDGSGGAKAPAGGETGEQPPAGGSPEDQPGGAGDEIPARSQAEITGRGGRVSPRLVRVPPFIAVRVRLRSADGADVQAAAAGGRCAAGGRAASVAADFDGLRPGRRLVLKRARSDGGRGGLGRAGP